jgi:hypothetical protein
VTVITPARLIRAIRLLPEHTPTGMDDSFVFTSKWQSRVKAFTFVLCAYTAVSCALTDWDHIFGKEHIFSNIRPGLKSLLNRAYGVDPHAASPTTAPEEPIRSCKQC